MQDLKLLVQFLMQCASALTAIAVGAYFAGAGFGGLVTGVAGGMTILGQPMPVDAAVLAFVIVGIGTVVVGVGISTDVVAIDAPG